MQFRSAFLTVFSLLVAAVLLSCGGGGKGPLRFPDLTVSKTADGTFILGEQGQFVITVENVGDAAANGPILIQESGILADSPDWTVENVFAASPWNCRWISSINRITCTGSRLASGATLTVELTVNVPRNAAVEEVENCVRVEHRSDRNPNNNEDCVAFTPVPPDTPDLSTAMSTTGTFTAGEQGVYEITLDNPGNAVAVSPLPVRISGAIADDPDWTVAGVSAPAPWDCTWDSSANMITCSDTELASGGSLTIQLTVNIPEDTADQEVENCARAEHTDDLNSSNDEDCASVTPVSPAEPDLSTAMTTVGAFIGGQQGMYEITLANTGNAPAASPLEIIISGVLVEDPDWTVANVTAPSPWNCTWSSNSNTITCTDTELGTSGSFSLLVTVNLPQAAAGTPAETCAASQHPDDPAPNNDQDCTSVTPTTPPPPTLEQNIEIIEGDANPQAVGASMSKVMEILYGTNRPVPSPGEPLTEEWHRTINEAELRLADTLENYTHQGNSSELRGRAFDLKLFIEEMNEVARAVAEATRECGIDGPEQDPQEAIGEGCDELGRVLNTENGHLFQPDQPIEPPFAPDYTVDLRSPAVPSVFTPRWEEDLQTTEPLAEGECQLITKESRGIMLRLHFREIDVIRDFWAEDSLPRTATRVPVWSMEWVPSQYVKVWQVCNTGGKIEQIRVDQRVKQDVPMNFFWRFFSSAPRTTSSVQSEGV